MAILTKKGMYDTLKRIMSSGGITDDMEKDLDRLKSDFDEREAILKKYGVVYAGEDKDDYEFEENTTVYTPDEENYRTKFEELNRKYIDRFFGGSDKKEITEAIDEEKEDIKYDDEVKSFDELLEREE